VYRFKRRNEDHGARDRYLITYADLITLLLGLFVILYATSQVDGNKFKELQMAFVDAFSKGGQDSPLDGGDGVLQGSKSGIPEPDIPPSSNKSLSIIAQKANSKLKSYLENGSLEIVHIGDQLSLRLPESLLFKSGKAELEREGYEVLDTIATVLVGLQNEITVDGHTDSDPIRTFQFESNWHLSLARAMNVTWRLIGKGINEQALSVRGFGASRPISENISEFDKAKNRRVEIIINDIPPYLPSTRGYVNQDSVEAKEN